MEHKGRENREKSLLYHLGSFPKKMAEHHHFDNLSEFVLHDICGEQGFNIRKAAYFVNNPDFKCFKGVAGYYHPESFGHESPVMHSSVWDSHKDFTAHMRQSTFNQQVRECNGTALDRDKAEKSKVSELAEQFDFSDPMYHSWNLKHDNQGLLLFQKPEDVTLINDHLYDFLHILSFCPVF